MHLYLLVSVVYAGLRSYFYYRMLVNSRRLRPREGKSPYRPFIADGYFIPALLATIWIWLLHDETPDGPYRWEIYVVIFAALAGGLYLGNRGVLALAVWRQRKRREGEDPRSR